MKKPKRSAAAGQGITSGCQDGGDCDVERRLESRREAFRADDGLREICEANGLVEDKFVREAHLLPSLDLFMSGLRNLRGLRHFGGLTALCCVNLPSLTSLSGLDSCCPGLESVSVTECGLLTTEGLEGLTGLTALHLSSNQLQSLHGVRSMIRLRKLWANNNRIISLEGLSGLEALEELWLCRNRLFEIGDDLPVGQTMRELNLAHNGLGYFKALLKLTPLAGLRSLILQDPHFGDNPVCSLSNYKMYVAYHLPQLASLDTEVISKESKAFANAIFVKKSMYYNMRSRIIKRRAGRVVRKATELCREKAADLQTTLVRLRWQSKHVEQRLMAERAALETMRISRERSETELVESEQVDRDVNFVKLPIIAGTSVAVSADATWGCCMDDGRAHQGRKGKSRNGTTDAPDASVDSEGVSFPMPPDKSLPSCDTVTETGLGVLQLVSKMQALTRAIALVETVLQRMEERVGIFKEMVSHTCKRAVSELMLEFDTGGDVRFEEGRPGDVWFSSCENLVKSRLISPSRHDGLAGGVKVSRVIRIHNRFLKNRFERSVREANAGKINSQEETPNVESARISVASSTVLSGGNPTEAVEERICSLEDGSPFLTPQSSQTASEHISRGDSQTDGLQNCTKAVQALANDIRYNGGARIVAQGDARRRQALGAVFSDLLRQENVDYIGETVAEDKTQQTSHMTEQQDPPRSGPVDDANITNDTQPPTGKTPVSDGSRGGRDTGGISGPGTQGGKKSDTRSSSSWNRNVEYLFFTATEGGFGAIDRDVKGGRGGAEEEGDVDEQYRRTSPDLLQLAEDGFCLPKWSKAEASPISAAATSTNARKLADPPGSSAGLSTTNVAVATAVGPSATMDIKRASMPAPLVLSRYLSEEDISCMNGASELDTTVIRHDSAVAPPSSGGFGNTKMPSPVCSLLVVKLYTGRSLQVPSLRLGGSGGDVLSEAWTSGFKSVSVSRVDRREGSDERIRGDGCRNQEWYVLDGALALPEYIIELDNSPEIMEITPSLAGLTKDTATGTGRPTLGADTLPFSISLARLASQLEIYVASHLARYETDISSAFRMQPLVPELGMTSSSWDGGGVCWRGVVVTKDHPSLAITQGSGRLLTRLSLHGHGLRAIEGLKACQNLEVLILSFNEISHLNGLAGLDRLQHLDLGYNVIEGGYGGIGYVNRSDDNASIATGDTKVHGDTGRVNDTSSRPLMLAKASIIIAGGTEGKSSRPTGEIINLPSLTRLDLNNNILHDLDALKALWQIAPSLSVLDMRGNPLRMARTYRSVAIRSIPGLEVLDGRSVSQQEISLRHTSRSLTLEMLRLNGRTKATCSGSRWIDPDPNNIVAIATMESYDDNHQRSSNESSSVHYIQTHGQTEKQRGQAVAEIATTVSSDEDSGHTAKTCFWQKENTNEDIGGGVKCSIAASGGGERVDDRNNNEEATCTTTENEDKNENNVNDKAAFISGRARKPSTAGGACAPSRGSRKSSRSTAVGNIGRPSSAPAMGNCRSASISIEALGSRGLSSVGSPSSGSGDGSGTTDEGVSEPRPTAGFLVEGIELVNLHNLSLQKLDGIERFLRLKVADLSGNELHDTAPLQPCSCLEELNLEGNGLTSAGLRGLMGLRRLAKLDLGYNQISDLHSLCDLTGLVQLSLENNLLHNLRGLDKLVNMIELYCGNNDIASTSEVDRLRHLPRLIILDISGNTVCSLRNFRLLVLYKIPSLKVLDGVGVGRKEITHAKVIFTGKLTEDVIRQKYKAGQVETLECLDLSKGKWRNVEVLRTLPFRALQELNLEKNFLVNFAALGGLPLLSVLRLSYNRIKSIGQADIEADNITSSPGECVFLRLEVLYLGFNMISNIAALCFECMPRLLAVDLQGNNIVNLGGLNHCRSLVEVNLNRNKIRQLGPTSALTGLSNLRKLRLEENGLRALVPGLAALTPSLLSLSLAQNRLANPTDLDRFGALPNLMELNVGGNPMARRPHSRLALLALFPSLAAVDSINTTPKEKELSLAISSSNRKRTTVTAAAPVTANFTGAKTPGDGDGGAAAVGSVSGGFRGSRVVSVAGGRNRHEHIAVVNIGGVMQKSALVHVGSMEGSRTALTSHVFSPIRPQDRLTPAHGTGAGSSRFIALSGKLVVRGAGGEECSVRVMTSKANISLLSSQERSRANNCGVGYRPKAGQRHASEPRRISGAPLSAPWQSGVKRPLKLTPMNTRKTLEGSGS